jgi:hypothetical protein
MDIKRTYPMRAWGRIRNFGNVVYSFFLREHNQSPRVKGMMILDHWARRARQFTPTNPLLQFGCKFYSQNDEDGIIAEICRRIGLIDGGVFVEFGVGNGLENNTILLLAKGWRGVWIDGQNLAFDAAHSSKLKFLRKWVTRDNCVEVMNEGLSQLQLDDVDLISLDLDGNDLYFCEAILDSGKRPRIFIVEYNGKLPPPVRWSIPYDAEHTWDETDFQGASLQSFVDLFERFNYRLVACNLTGVNAFFVDRKYEQVFTEVADDPARLFMPPDPNWFLISGSPTSPRTVASFISD